MSRCPRPSTAILGSVCSQQRDRQRARSRCEIYWPTAITNSIAALAPRVVLQRPTSVNADVADGVARAHGVLGIILHLPLATCHLGRDSCCAQLPLSNACRYRLEVSAVDIYDRRQWGCCATSCGEADNVISVHLAPWRVGVTPSSVALLGEQGNNANSSQASWVRRAIRPRSNIRCKHNRSR